jgi:hypothetical protein
MALGVGIAVGMMGTYILSAQQSVTRTQRQQTVFAR